MSVARLPSDAFAFYVAMGTDRSYEMVGKQYGVCKRTVLRTAQREKWQERLEEIARKAQTETDEKLAKTVHEANMRHRKLLLAVASRAAQALQRYELRSAMEAVRAAEVAVKLERLLLGESTESKSISVEQASRDEVSRFLVSTSEAADWPGEGEADGANPSGSDWRRDYGWEERSEGEERDGEDENPPLEARAV
jgi:protein-tyrosine-phosphatase